MFAIPNVSFFWIFVRSRCALRSNIFFHANILPHFSLPVCEICNSGDFDISALLIQLYGVCIELKYTQFDPLVAGEFDLFLKVSHGYESNPFAAAEFLADVYPDPRGT